MCSVLCLFYLCGCYCVCIVCVGSVVMVMVVVVDLVVLMLQQNEPDVILQKCGDVRKLVMLLLACFVPHDDGHRFKQPISLLPLRLLFALAVVDAATAAACETAKRNAASACDRKIASA